MSSSEAHKRASIKYNKNRESITIRPDKETGAAIRAAAAAAGMSVTAYILNCINGAGELPFTPEQLEKITDHLKQTGESLADFLNRAVKDTIKRDDIAGSLKRR